MNHRENAAKTASQPVERNVFREGHNGVPMGSNGKAIDGQSTTGSTPEDVAALYAWANLRGAKYRDYSASRREHRAQVRYRAAKSLLERELKAQGEAEASAEAAEREARDAEARALTSAANQPQHARFAALRAAEAAALKAAADRVEAARRAEAAAHATVLALREERELAEAHASAAEQAMIYSEAEALRRQLAGPQPQLTLDDAASIPPAAVAEVPAAVAELQLEASAGIPAEPSAPKAGGWQPLSEAILGPDQDWSPARPSADSSIPQIAEGPLEEQPRPAWFVVFPQAERAATEPSTEPEAAPESEPSLLASLFAEEKGQDVNRPSATAASEPVTELSAEQVGEPTSTPEPLPRWHALRQAVEASSREATVFPSAAIPEVRTPLLAVFSLAGGAGATSVVASLGRALSASGEKVLLVDTTSQAMLPFYFGGRELQTGLMRNWSPPEGTGESLSLILHDATQINGDTAAQQSLTRQIFASAIGAQRILVDLSPTSAWLLRRWANLRPAVLVPLVPGMDSVIRLEATERLFRSIVGSDGNPLLPYYVLNHFDASLPLHLDVRAVLRRRLGDRLLRYTIRNSPAVAEALADGMTVHDYAPETGITQEYRDVAAWLQHLSPPRPVTSAHLRWGES